MSNLIYKKMSDVMKDIKSVGKDQKNVSQGYAFRGIDQFVNALYPALTKHGVFMTPRCVKEEHLLKDVTRSNGKSAVDKHVTLLMEFDFFAEDGSKITVGPIPGEGLDSGDKATNKAMSACLKYALIQTFSVPTQDMAEADLDSPVLETNTPAWVKPKVTTSGVLTTNAPHDGTILVTKVVEGSTTETHAVSSSPVTLPEVATKVAKFVKPGFRKDKKVVPGTAVASTGDEGWGN